MVRKTKVESTRTRERILDAAEIEMLACGVTHASLERIANRADVTRGAVYWHFADKTGLLEAIVARTNLPMRDLRQCIDAHSPGVEPLQLLRQMLLQAGDGPIGTPAKLGKPPDGAQRQMEAVQSVHHRHIEWRGGGSLLLKTMHMEIVVIGAIIG